MVIDEAYKGFRSFLKDRGKTVTNLGVVEGISLAIEFFRDVPMQDANEKDGDGLIFYYAIVNRGRGSPYEVGMIRTFRKVNGGVARLRLTFNYSWVEALLTRGLQERLKPASSVGDRYCWKRDELPKFEQFIRSHPVIETVSAMTARSVHLRLEPQWGTFG